MLQFDAIHALCAKHGCEILRNEPLSAHTTFRIGGACKAMILLPDVAAAQAVIAYLNAEGIPHRIIGRGSNLLVSDAGYDGVVLKLHGALAQKISIQPGGSIYCGAGVPLVKLCTAAAEAGLSGLEFAYGIPGTVGGAVYMNAGAYGGEMAQVLTEVEALTADGKLQTLTAADLQLSYRRSCLMETPMTVLSVTLRCQAAEKAAIWAKMNDFLARRKEKQPLEYPSAGSTFKRPAGSYASMLIDQCGLKGYRVGDAQVSEKHAGFVINRGAATYADVMAVCTHVQQVVQAQTGYHLELEPELL